MLCKANPFRFKEYLIMSALMLAILGGMLLAYLIGSFPTAVVMGRVKMGIDIREFGSGNAGATNTFRVLGTRPGITVMAIDIFKGYAATALAWVLLDYHVDVDRDVFVAIQIAFGMSAVMGHVFPVYARFKGGKGVASLLGMVLALHTTAALACVFVFLCVFLSTRYVSLGSMIAGISFPILVSLPYFNHYGEPNNTLIIFGVIVSSLLIITHKKNIGRLIKGEENRANLKLKKKKE